MESSTETEKDLDNLVRVLGRKKVEEEQNQEFGCGYCNKIIDLEKEHYTSPNGGKYCGFSCFVSFTED